MSSALSVEMWSFRIPLSVRSVVVRDVGLGLRESCGRLPSLTTSSHSLRPMSPVLHPLHHRVRATGTTIFLVHALSLYLCLVKVRTSVAALPRLCFQLFCSLVRPCMLSSVTASGDT